MLLHVSRTIDQPRAPCGSLFAQHLLPLLHPRRWAPHVSPRLRVSSLAALPELLSRPLTLFSLFLFFSALDDVHRPRP